MTSVLRKNSKCVHDLWPVVEPWQKQEKNSKEAGGWGGEGGMQFLEIDELDTGEELLLNAFLS